MWIAAATVTVLIGCSPSARPSSSELSPQAQHGQQLSQSRNCVSCHSVDGSNGVGPSWEGIHGHSVELQDGSTTIVDADYIAQSIRDPQARLVTGFAANMPAYADLSDADIAALTAYIESLADAP